MCYCIPVPCGYMLEVVAKGIQPQGHTLLLTYISKVSHYVVVLVVQKQSSTT